MIDEADIDGDGVISFDEFLKMMGKNSEKKKPGHEYEEIFKIFDKDGSG